MKRRIFRIIGLIPGIIAVLTGVYAFSNNSLSLAGGYLLISLVAGIFITRVFCASCPVRGAGVHILPCYIARLWKGMPGRYTPEKSF